MSSAERVASRAEQSWERRQLGPGSTSGLGAGNMIGAGVFTTSGFVLADLREPCWVLLAWALGGLVALCGAASYACLVRRIPRSGGEYTLQLHYPAKS